MLGVVMVIAAMFLTGGFFTAPPAVFEDVPQTTTTTTEVTTTTEPTTEVPTTTPTTTEPETSVVESTEDPDLTTTTKTSKTMPTTPTSTTTRTTTTRKQDPYRQYSGGRFSKMIVFLDIQRIVFYKTDPATGADYPAYAVRCSTGTSQYPTPTTPANRPFKLSGGKAVLSRFSSQKSPIPCWVRYATHLRGSIYFHSIPLDYLGTRDKIDYSKCYMSTGYARLLAGKTSSHGCIRMAVRDAKFLYDNTYRGMPVYVFSSSSGHQLAPAQPLPPAPNPRLYRDWDPTDWNSPKYVPLPTVTDPTTTTEETTTEVTTEETTTPTTTTEPSAGDDTGGSTGGDTGGSTGAIRRRHWWRYRWHW